MSDTTVLTALIEHGPSTRAELASATGLSKPTVTESMRRLEAAGAVLDTGDRSTGRGRAGVYYDLSPATGLALAVSVAPEGIVAEALDVRGKVLARETAGVTRPAKPTAVARALSSTAKSALHAAGADRARLAVVSVADPVDRHTGRLVQLPDSPFLVGTLDPAGALAPVVGGSVVVDNDVNWSALAERSAGDGDLDDFAFLHLGEGLGCALVADGSVVRGATGLAGEVAHVVVPGPRGLAMACTEVFERLGLHHEGSTAIDVAEVVRSVTGRGARATARLHVIADAVAGVVAAVVAVSDPSVVVLGGSWGTEPAVLAAVRERIDSSPRPVPLRPADVPDAALAGARADAVARLRALVTQSPPAAETLR
nr:ROK family protein [Knoellia sp. DB2414S]